MGDAQGFPKRARQLRQEERRLDPRMHTSWELGSETISRRFVCVCEAADIGVATAGDGGVVAPIVAPVVAPVVARSYFSLIS